MDATVVELVPPGGRRTEPLGSLSASAADSLSVRAAGAGGHRTADPQPPSEEGPPDGGRGTGA
jgi:hypothetical protein